MERTASVEIEWERYQAPVFSFMRRMGATPELAGDLSQETFLRAIRGAHRYRGDAPVGAWILGIGRNVFREWLRSGRREIPVADVYEQAGSDASTVEAVDVSRALARLDPDHREVLVLRFVLDLPSKNVSQALGISDAAVRQRVTRAKAEFANAWST